MLTFQHLRTSMRLKFSLLSSLTNFYLIVISANSKITNNSNIKTGTPRISIKLATL
jgi:hypothetical protein